MPTQSFTEQLVRIQSEVQSGDVTAYFEKSVVVDGVSYVQPWKSYTWNTSTKPVTVGAQTLTYGEVMQFVVAIAEQEKIDQTA